MQIFLFASAAFLDSVAIAIKNLEHRQRLQIGGQFLRHVQRRGQGHHGVKPDVVFTAKSARIGERRGRRQPAQVRARTQLLDQRGQQAVERRFLHQAHQRLQRAESQRVCALLGKSGGESESGGDLGTDGGDQHAATDLSQKFSAGAGRIHRSSFPI